MKSLNDDERYLKRVTLKTFKDNGVNYYFDVPKYMRILKEKDWSAEEIAKKAGQMQANHKIPADAKIKVGRTYGRVSEYCEGDVDKDGAEPSVRMDTIKQLGMVFEENEYAFLIEVSKWYEKEIKKVTDVSMEKHIPLVTPKKAPDVLETAMEELINMNIEEFISLERPEQYDFTNDGANRKYIKLDELNNNWEKYFSYMATSRVYKQEGQNIMKYGSEYSLKCKEAFGYMSDPDRQSKLLQEIYALLWDESNLQYCKFENVSAPGGARF